MIIRCPECGIQISDAISKCPHCGYVLKRAITKMRLSLFAAIIVIGAVLFILFRG